MRPDRLIGNRLPNVVTVPSDPEDLSDRLTAAGLEAESADRILAVFSLHDGYGDPDNEMQALCDSTSHKSQVEYVVHYVEAMFYSTGLILISKASRYSVIENQRQGFEQDFLRVHDRVIGRIRDSQHRH